MRPPSADLPDAAPPTPLVPVTATPARPRGELASLLVLGTVFFTVALDFVVMMPLGPQLMRVFRINIQQFNFAVSAYALAAGVSGLTAALFLDRFDRKRALLGLYAGFAVGTLGCALAPSYGWLVGMRALAGVFGGVIGGVVLAIVGDTIPEARRGAAVGIVTAAFPVAQVLGVPLSLFAAGKLTWHVPFSGLAVASVFVGVAAAFALPSVRGHLRAARAAGPESAGAGLWAILANRNHLWAFALSAIITLSGFLVIPDLATFMVKNVGVDEPHLPWLYAVGGACALWTMPLTGRLADRRGKLRVFSVMILATAVVAVGLTHLPPVHWTLAAAATALLMVTTTGRYVPAMAMVTASVEPRHRGGFMSVNSAVSQVFSALAAGAAGLIVSDAPDGRLLGFGVAGWLSAALSVAALFIARRLRKVDDGPAEGGAIG